METSRWADAKPRVAIFPTLLAGGWLWDRQVPVIEALGLEVHVMPEPLVNIDAVPTVSGIEDYCIDFLKDHDGPWILIGNSYGGMIALRVAQRLQGRVIAVVASGCPGIGDMMNLGLGTRAMASLEYAKSVRAKILAKPERGADEVVQQVLDQIRWTTAPRMGIRLLRAARGIDMSREIAASTIRTALIWGAADQITPGEVWKKAAKGSAHVEFREIDDAGHSPMFEQPEAYNAELASFLASVVGADARRAAPH